MKNAIGTFTPRLALLGNPNAGKTTLFNALTGMHARVGNYPGITVEHREGNCTLPGGVQADVIDLPGAYSLVPRAEDEALAVRGLLGTIDGVRRPDIVVAVVDATHLERNLYIVSQLREQGIACIVALTMTDVAEADGLVIDTDALSSQIGAPVVRAAGTRPDEVDALRAQVAETLEAEPQKPAPLDDPMDDKSAAAIGELFRGSLHSTAPARVLGRWALATVAAGTAGKLGLSESELQKLKRVEVDRARLASDVERRYVRVEGWTQAALTSPPTAPRSRTLTSKIDRVVLHPVLGPFLLLSVFGLLFQTLFVGVAPMMDGISDGIAGLGALVAGALPANMPLLRSLWLDGVVAGVGNVLVFVPQIAVLFLFVGVLEDTGYLARAAFLLDRLMSLVGLHGRAFVPMLSGFACAVPAIMATRTIENEKDRLVTILVTPLVSCSARLPVYALIIATVFSDAPLIFGVIATGTVVMFSMYGLSIASAITMAFVFKRTLLKSPTPPLVLELPTYRVPRTRELVRQTLSKVRVFLIDAGTIILAITIVLWGLFTFPQSPELEQRFSQERDTIAEQPVESEAQNSERLDAVDAAEAQAKLSQSYGGRLGHAIEPVIAPLGFDWKIGVGLIASFAAREVLVSTLGLIYGLGDGTDEESVQLRSALREDTHEASGERIYTPLSGLSLMVFFVLAMQCMSTLAAVRRETKGFRWPLFQFAYMTTLAYVASLAVYQIGSALGFA